MRVTGSSRDAGQFQEAGPRFHNGRHLRARSEDADVDRRVGWSIRLHSAGSRECTCRVDDSRRIYTASTPDESGDIESRMPFDADYITGLDSQAPIATYIIGKR